MKKSFTQEMTWLHTWSGLVFGWALFAIFLTGTLCVFWMEIDVWARPEVHALHVADRAVLTRFSEDYLKKNGGDSRRWGITLPDPDARNPTLALTWQDKSGMGQRREFVPDGSGQPIRTQTNGGRFFVDFHWTLNTPPPYGPAATKNPLPFMFIGAAGIAFLIGTVSGVIIHKKIFKDFFTFRPKAKSGQRRWLDAHNVLGVIPLPFHVLIVLTGLFYPAYHYIPSAEQVLGKIGSLGAATGAVGPGGPAGAQVRGPRMMGGGPGDMARGGPRRGPGGPRGGEGGAGRPFGAAPQAGPVTTYPLVMIVQKAEQQFGAGSTSAISVRNPGRANAVVEVTRRRDDGIVVSNRHTMTFDGVTGAVTRTVVKQPPIRTAWDAIASLHFAFFGGAAMRLLYFVCGAAGAAMMACGLLLFTVKRREKAHSAAAERFYALVDKMNVAAIAGPMFACIAYLWAVRLLPDVAPHKDWEIYTKLRFLPLDMAARQDWEIYCFWGAWGLSAVHSALRAPRKAWVEQLATTAILCLGLPVLGFLVPNSSLPAMIAQGDWKTAGVDLSAIGFGVALAWGAWKVSGRSFAKLLATPSLSPAE